MEVHVAWIAFGAAILSSIISLLSIFFNFKSNKRINKYRSKLDEKNHVSKKIFDAVFDLYKNLCKRIAEINLTSTIYLNAMMNKTKKRDDIYLQLVKLMSDFEKICLENYFLIEKQVFKSLDIYCNFLSTRIKNIEDDKKEIIDIEQCKSELMVLFEDVLVYLRADFFNYLIVD